MRNALDVRDLKDGDVIGRIEGELLDCFCQAEKQAYRARAAAVEAMLISQRASERMASLWERIGAVTGIGNPVSALDRRGLQVRLEVNEGRGHPIGTVYVGQTGAEDCGNEREPDDADA